MKTGVVIQLVEISDLKRALTFPEIRAATLAKYEALGAAHLMFHLRPSTPTAYERLAEAVALYRATKTIPAPANSGA